MNTSAPTTASFRAAREAFGVRVRLQPLLVVGVDRRVRTDRPITSAGDDVRGPGDLQETDDGVAGRADSGDDDAQVLELLAHDLEPVLQCGERDDAGAVLVIVEDRDIEFLAQACLDLEAARGRDVLEVDSAVGRGDGLADGDDLLGVLRVEGHRPGVDVGELLEQHGLALHHRHRRLGADVAEAEHRGAVGDHGDGVAFDRQAARILFVLRDRLAHAGHTGGVGTGEIVAVAQGHLRSGFELPAEVEEESPVRDLVDLDSRQGIEGVGDFVGVGDIAGVGADVDDDRVRSGFDDVEGGDRRTGGGGCRATVRSGLPTSNCRPPMMEYPGLVATMGNILLDIVFPYYG